MVKGDGVNRKQPRERGVLIGVLSSLVVLIIGLVMIIVINAINADDEMSSNICGGDNLSDIYGCIYSDEEFLILRKYVQLKDLYILMKRMMRMY